MPEQPPQEDIFGNSGQEVPVNQSQFKTHTSNLNDLSWKLDRKSNSYSGTGAPTSTPNKIGDVYVNTTTEAVYVAVGTSSSSGWVIQNRSSLNNDSNSIANTSTAFTAQTVYLTRCMCNRSGVVARMGVWTVVVAGTAKLAIYVDNAGSPQALLAQTASYSPTYLGSATVALVSPIHVTVGTYYWVGLLSSVAVTVGYHNSVGKMYYKAIASNDLPNPMPTGGATAAYWLSVFAI